MPCPQQGAATPENENVTRWVRLCRWLWKHLLPFLWFTLIINVAINIGSTWLITPTKNKAAADSSILGNIAGWISAHWLFSILLGTCSGSLLLLTWVGRRWPRSQLTVPPSRSQQNRVSMIGRLRRSYQDLRIQTLQGIAWMEVTLSEKPDAVQNASTLLLRTVNQSECLLPTGTSILDAYDQAEHDLLILGTPGAGKSTLLLELAQQLVERAAGDTEHPLPVILPLSSWAEKRLPLQDWIVEQLAESYDIPRRVSEQWVLEDAVLPLLDGLDEMVETMRPICIATINTYHQTHFGVPLVICSRTADYDTAAEHQQLILQNAVVVQPLSFQQVDAFLLQAGKAVVALRREIKKNLALRELATTPLMLSVLMLTYQGTTVRELPSKGALLQQQVWTDYVSQMIQRKGNEKRYPLEQTCRWLTWLAQQMRAHQQTIFYAEYLQADWLTSKQQRIAMWLTTHIPALVLGVLAGILVLLFLIGSTTSSVLLQMGLFGGFAGGCLSQNVGARAVTIGRYPSALRRVSLINCILLGILVAETLLPFVGADYSLSDWVRDGGLLCLGSGLSAWIFQMFLFRYSSQTISVSSTRSSLQGRVSAWLQTIAPPSIWQAALIWGAGIGLSTGLLFWFDFGSIFAVPSYFLYFGLSAGLTVMLISVILDASVGTFRFAERIHWTWQSLRRPRHLLTSVFITGVAFLLFGLSFMFNGLGNGQGSGPGAGAGLNDGMSTTLSSVLSGALSEGLSAGLSYGLSVGLSYWLLFGLYQGMVQEQVEDQERHQFNQGIRRSLRNGALVSLVSAFIIVSMCVLKIELKAGLEGISNGLTNGLSGLSTGLSSGLSQELSDGIFGLTDELSTGLGYGIILLISGFLLMWAMSGGLTILRHYVIRWLLACSHRFPWRAQVFLDDATARILLQRVGGGYRFMHRLLLDYFADLGAPPSVVLPLAPPMPQAPSS